MTMPNKCSDHTFKATLIPHDFFCLFVCLFVIHVWHPRFPLNGIKKYFTWSWLVLVSSQWGHHLSFGLVWVWVVFSVSLFLPWQEQTSALSTLFTTLIPLRLVMTSWPTLWRHLKDCCCCFVVVGLFDCLFVCCCCFLFCVCVFLCVLLLFFGGAEVRLSLCTMTGTKLADTPYTVTPFAWSSLVVDMMLKSRRHRSVTSSLLLVCSYHHTVCLKMP